MSPQNKRPANKNLLLAEKAAYEAYDCRVREMTYSGHGVLPHEGNNQKMIVSALISLAGSSGRQHFSREVQAIRQKAVQDPVHYSPLAHALTAAESSLNQGSTTKTRPGR